MKNAGVVIAFAAVVLSLVLVSLNASATVTYYWFPATGSHGLPKVTSGQVEITDDAWGAEQLTYSASHMYGPGDPASPILDISFAGEIYPREDTGGEDVPWFVDANFSFGKFLTGSLTTSTSMGTSEYSMHTAAGAELWTITNFVSEDPQYGECYLEPCSGATGYWVLDKSVLPVPEPDMFAACGFLAFALIGTDMVRRRRRSRHRHLMAGA